MGSVSKHTKGWRAYVDRKGHRRSRVFDSKTAANDWIKVTEAKILDGKLSQKTTKTFDDLLDRYEREVSSKKRGYKREKNFINQMRRDSMSPKQLSDLTPSVLTDWRDKRLAAVSDASVRREWNLLNHMFNVAINEWEWMDTNPLKKLKRPQSSKPRDRLISEDERELILHAASYDKCPETKMSRVGAAFLFAIETGMRASEIAGINPGDVNLRERTCHLPETKNGTARTVPLSREAIRLLKQVDCDFDLSADQISSLFRKAKGMAGIEDLTFHDTRHQAITNLSGKLEVLELARMVGHRDLNKLLIYYNKTAAELAKKL